MVRSGDADAPESVHLCSFPEADEAFINPEIEQQMGQLMQVVQLGRACRNLANIKVRQPLSRLIVMGADLDKDYRELVKDELNVKEIVFTDNADAFTGYRLKPQLRTLGPRFGKNLGKVSQLLGAADGHLAMEGSGAENLRLELTTRNLLAQEDILVETTQKPGLVTGKLRCHRGHPDRVDPKLIDEGYAREVISKLQTTRRVAGLEVTDRIMYTILRRMP